MASPDNSQFFNPCKFHVYRSAALSLPGSASNPSVLVFDTVTEDTGSNYSTSTGRFTVTKAGRYIFFAQINVAVASGDLHYFSFYKNGSDLKHFGGIASSTTYNQQYGGSSGELNLAVNDYITVDFINSNAGARTCNVGSLDTYFSGFMISAT